MFRHLVLIGFKNVGKTAVGKALATRMGMHFVDLDERIAKDYAAAHGLKRSSCREIVRKEGLEAFRALEGKAFKALLAEQSEPVVITTGGGAPMNAEFQELLQGHILIHVTAPKSIVYERIMVHGRPSFFDKDVDAFEAFEHLWKQRTPVFNQLATLSVSNTKKIADLVDEIVLSLPQVA